MAVFSGFDPVGFVSDAASSAVDAATSAVGAVGSFAGGLYEGLTDQMVSVYQSVFDAAPWLKDFAASPGGEVFLRSFALGLGNAAYLAASGGPVGAALWSSVQAAPVMATHDQGYWEALGSQIAWQVKEGASILGAEGVTKALLPDDLVARVTEWASKQGGGAYGLATKLVRATPGEVASALGVRQDAAAIALGALRGIVPDLSAYDPTSGRLRLTAANVPTPIVASRPALAVGTQLVAGRPTFAAGAQRLAIARPAELGPPKVAVPVQSTKVVQRAPVVRDVVTAAPSTPAKRWGDVALVAVGLGAVLSLVWWKANLDT